eukprot:3297044-Pyramimonas_sp.AAC.1
MGASLRNARISSASHCCSVKLSPVPNSYLRNQSAPSAPHQRPVSALPAPNQCPIVSAPSAARSTRARTSASLAVRAL